MDKQKTGTIIKEARMKKGYTQQELGDLIGISNKAISRWENGDSFPDVGILEYLANALNLKIEEIVLGRISEQSTENLAKELVRTARLQERERKRMLWCFLICVPILFWLVIIWLLIIGYQTMSGNTIFSHSHSFILPTLLVMGILLWNTRRDTVNNSFAPAVSQPQKASADNRNRIRITLILLSGIYSIVLMCGMITMIAQGTLPAFLPLVKTGPFLNTQLCLIYVGNVLYIGYCLFQNARYRAKPDWTVYVSIAIAHLQLCYSDSLYHMDTLDVFLQRTLYNSALFVVIALAAIIIVNVQNRHNKQKAPSAAL